MSTVIYVAIVEGDQDGGYSAFFPDLPGCVTGAETMLELPASAREALSLHLQGMSEDGEAFPEPTALEDITGDADVKEIGRILVDADVEDAPVRVNISIGAQFLKRVDVAAEARGMTRSGFLIEGAKQIMASTDDASRHQPVMRWLWANRETQEKRDCLHNRVLSTLDEQANSTDRNRYLIVPTTTSDLVILWDRLEDQVVDVIECDASSAHYFKPSWIRTAEVASDPLKAASGVKVGWTRFSKTG